MALVRTLLLASIIGCALGYNLGRTYVYKYNTEVTVDNFGSSEGSKIDGKVTGYQITAAVHVASIWESSSNDGEKLMKIEIVNPKLLVHKKASYEIHKSKLEEISQSALYIQFVNRKIKKIFSDPDENAFTKNLKKGIASLFQFQTTSQQISENDISGDCNVVYTVVDRTVQKTKENCSRRSEYEYLSQSHGVLSATTLATSEIFYEMISEESNLFQIARATDDIKLFSNLWKQIGVHVTSNTVLKLETEQSGAPLISGDDIGNAIAAVKETYKVMLIEDNIFSEFSLKSCGKNCQDLSETVRKFQKYLKTKNLSNLVSASTFLKLLKHFRVASKEDIIKVLKTKEYQTILPQLLDVVAFAQTNAAVEAAVESLNFAKEPDLLERYLLSLSLIPHPNEDVVNTIMGIIRKNTVNIKIKASLVATLGALAKTYNERNKDSNKQILHEVGSYLVEELHKCNTDHCTLLYLRGLRNALLPRTVPTLVDFAAKGGKPALEALIALKYIDNYPPNCEKVFLSIFHQIGKQYDNSCRVVAAEILLQKHYSDEVLKHLLIKLTDQSDSEFATSVAEKIAEKMTNSKELRTKVLKLLSDKEVKHYYSLSQKGSSTSFTKPLISTGEINTTYGVVMEMLSGGILRRSSFDVEIQNPGGNQHILSVGIFADGLNSIVGESSEQTDEAPKAGMELVILGVALRPYIFFEGSSELMGHVWSGTASEPTPALQGNFLLADFLKVVALQNGLTVQLSLESVLSTDLSASIEISLWNRNSHSMVKNGVALMVQGSANIETGFVAAQGEFTFMGQSAIDFATNLEFSETPFKMCVQMEQQDFVFRVNSKKSTVIPGTKYLVKNHNKRKLFIPAKSYALHKRNDELCSLMLAT